MRRAIAVLAVFAGVACHHNPPKPPQPQPTPPSPVCEAGQNTCCWHQPPGNPWLYACPAPNAPGGVLNVAGGPAQCVPANICSSTPPPVTCPPGQHPENGVCVPDTKPPSGDVPPIGVATGPEKLLRIAPNAAFLQTAAGVRFDPFGAEPCCSGWNKCDEQGWPMANECFIDETHKYGANLWHFRIGPWFAKCDNGDDPNCGEPEWSDYGGAYNADGSWNEKFWTQVRALVWRAYKMGAYVEIVPVDDWWLKGATGSDNPSGKYVSWPQSAVNAWGNTPDPWAEKLYNKTVEQTGCFGNTIYATGNEEDLIPRMNAAHVQWRIDTMRKAFKSVGCNMDHIIGTGSFKDGIGADYQITHSDSPVTGPCNGRYCVNNEHNGNSTPQNQASNYDQARKAGQRWDAWRAGMNDANWESQLDLIRQIRGGGSGPVVGCFAPDGSDTSMWVDPPTQPANRPPQLMAQFNAAKAAVGDRTGITGQCTPEREPCAPPIFIGCIDTSDLVAAEMRKQGLCASGSWGGGPEIAAMAPDGMWEQYHPCFTETGAYTGNPYKFAWKYKGTNPTPPQPGPTPPPSGQCTNPPAPKVDHFNVKEHTKGPNKTVVDSTAIVHDRAYCQSIGFSAIDCPVRPEGDPLRATCELEAIGGYNWVALPPGGQQAPDNPAQAWVPRNNTGVAKVCSTLFSTTCGQVTVTP